MTFPQKIGDYFFFFYFDLKFRKQNKSALFLIHAPCSMFPSWKAAE